MEVQRVKVKSEVNLEGGVWIVKSEVQSVTTNKSKTNIGCEAGKHQGCVKKYTNSPSQIMEVQR